MKSSVNVQVKFGLNLADDPRDVRSVAVQVAHGFDSPVAATKAWVLPHDAAVLSVRALAGQVGNSADALDDQILKLRRGASRLWHSSGSPVLAASKVVQRLVHPVGAMTRRIVQLEVGVRKFPRHKHGRYNRPRAGGDLLGGRKVELLGLKPHRGEPIEEVVPFITSNIRRCGHVQPR